MRFKSRGVLGALIAALTLGALTASSAFASSPPTVETKAVTGITTTTATLNGTVNPNGAEAKYYFEYGPTKGLGTSTPAEAAGSGKSPVEVASSIKGLTKETKYYVRIVATNSSGTTKGASLQVFTTRPEYAPGPLEVVVTSGKVSELTFSATSGSAVFAWGAGKSIECTSSEFSGHFINSKELEGKMVWHRCFGEGYECADGKEEVQSEELKGTLGYINKAKKENGIKLWGASTEVFANNVACPGGTYPLTGSLGGRLSLPINTKIPTTEAFSIVYTQEKDKQLTGELGGQLLWDAGSTEFGIGDSLNTKANKEFEIKE